MFYSLLWPLNAGRNEKRTYIFQQWRPAAGCLCTAAESAGGPSPGRPGSPTRDWTQSGAWRACPPPGPPPSQLLLRSHFLASVASWWCWHKALRRGLIDNRCRRLQNTWKQISKSWWSERDRILPFLSYPAYLTWFSKLWLGYSGLQALLSKPPLQGVRSMKWVLLRPSSSSTENECEPNWEMTPKATKARTQSRGWEVVQAPEPQKKAQFPFTTRTSCAALGKSFNPWTLALNYKAEITPTLPHCYGNNTVYGCDVCVCTDVCVSGLPSSTPLKGPQYRT